MIQSCLFNLFNDNQQQNSFFCFVTTLVCHYVNAIYKAIRKSDLKPKNSCGQSSIKTFYKRITWKKGKLNIITSIVANKYAVVRSFGSTSIVGGSKKNLVLLQKALSLIPSWFLPVSK